MALKFFTGYTHQISKHSFSWARRSFAPAFWPSSLSSLCNPRRGYFVCFQETPNEDCYKFYVDDIFFLQPGSHTMMFDRTTDYQSPLAHHILNSLPMVEEVTIGSSFVTVKRVEKANAEAAARYFAMRFNGTMSGTSTDDDYAAAIANRSQALQHSVYQAMTEGEEIPEQETSDQGTFLSEKSAGVGAKTAEAARGTRQGDSEDGTASDANPAPPQGDEQQSNTQEQGDEPASAGDFFELGGFKISSATMEDAQLDEEAIRSLIESTCWSELKLHVCALITDHLYSGQPHVSPDAPHPHVDTLPQEGDSEVVLMIKELIDTNIRPQLQKDGGDIRFIRYDPETGLMAVELLGACRTCKSGPTTLVDLIERTTFHWIPEVKGVLDVRKKLSAFEKFSEELEDDGGDRDAGTRVEPDHVKVPVLRRQAPSATTGTPHIDKDIAFTATDVEERKVSV